jgi:hypothetical protein
VPIASPVASGDRVADADGWLRLDTPARQDEVMKSRTILVRGEVGRAVGTVWLGLESRSGKILATRTIHLEQLDIAAAMPFEGRFGLASPGASGRLFVTATAIGPDGVPIQSVRRRIETTAEPTPTDAPASDPIRGPHADLGVDGPVVGLVGR